jgi:recombinational DNA repair protein (RecF pathway)
MREQLQIQLEGDTSHGTLRRCQGCGTSSRRFDFERTTGVVLCERCAARARRERLQAGPDWDPADVNFLV